MHAPAMTEEHLQYREVLAPAPAAGRGRQAGAAAAVDRLRNLPFEDLGFAKRRPASCAAPRRARKSIFGEGKSAAQIAAIGARVIATGVNLVVTRLAAEKGARAARRKLRGSTYHPDAKSA